MAIPPSLSRVPVVLTQAEARAVLAQMDGRHALMAGILYGAGLRFMECVRLRVKDVDFGYSQLTPRSGIERRHPLEEQTPQRAVKTACSRAIPCASR